MKTTLLIPTLGVAVVTVIWAGCSSTPMVEVAHQMRRQAHEVEVQASKPFYGTGVVTRVSGNIVDIQFDPAQLPHRFARFILVRDKTLVGKVEAGSGERGATYLCWIREGNPQVGDLALGWQREKEFTPPSPWKKLP